MRIPPAVVLLSVVAAFGLQRAVADRPEAQKQVPTPVVAEVRAKVQPEIDSHLADAQVQAMKKLASGEHMPAAFKLPVRVKAVKDPWGGMADLERCGLDVISAAHLKAPDLRTLLGSLAEAIHKPTAAPADATAKEPPADIEGHVRHLTAVLDRAKGLRDQAVAKIGGTEPHVLFSYPKTLTDHFGPQMPFTDKTKTLLENDHAFCWIASRYFDWQKLLGAACCLSGLADPAYLAQLEQTLENVPPIEKPVDGLGGDVLYAKETPHGWVVIGGKGANTYELSMPVALLIDLGGADVYRGKVASSYDFDRANQVVIDLAGDDRYEGDRFSVACGRTGVGMLVDLAGNDHYQLASRCGGTGFGGIGVLCDSDGDDTYVGSKFTQGVAIAGMGLLLDRGGNDTHTSFGYSIGLGGPAAVGAVIDTAGNDSYQCGKKYPSNYNKSAVNPDDPKFQYTAMGMGMGLGRRILSRKRDDHKYALAGGLGMVLDATGDDRYESSNFSQGCGYYFGVGLKMDLAGRDTYVTARYGLAAGAHYGMGLFVEYQGQDTYRTTGPRYNGGCAWDFSAFLFVEAGAEGDTYEWQATDGPAFAEIGSWAAFAELGGDDVYRLTKGLGCTAETAMSVFFDQSGSDDYELADKPADFAPADETTQRQDPGGLFVDR